MIKKNYLLTIVLLMPLLCFPQYGETIRTGRPGQSIGGYTVGKSVFQVQSGLSYNEFDDDISLQTKAFTKTNILRLGIWEKFEISGLVNYRFEETDRPSGTTSARGFSNTQIGARYNILEADGAIPALGIQGRLLLRAQSEDFRREKLGSKFLLAAGNRITDWVSYTTNLGVVWRGDGAGAVGLYTFNLGFNLSEKLGTFAEIYGRLNDFTTNYDAGFYYLVNPDLQLDISAGWQGNDDLDDWFVDAGLSYRFDWRNN